MISKPRKIQILALCLAGLAGYIDALGFMSLNGVFMSFMSGNSTRLAVGLSRHGLTEMTLLPLGVIILFVSGVVAGAVIAHFARERRSGTVMICVSVIIIAAALFHLAQMDGPAIACMVLAMGIENNTFVKNGEVEIGVTYITGTLVKLGQHLAGSFLGGPKYGWVPYLMLWSGLMGGAILGSFSSLAFGLGSLWIAGGISAVLTALLWTMPPSPLPVNPDSARP